MQFDIGDIVKFQHDTNLIGVIIKIDFSSNLWQSTFYVVEWFRHDGHFTYNAKELEKICSA